MYTGLSGKVYAVSYDVIRFEDIASVSDSIKSRVLLHRMPLYRLLLFYPPFKPSTSVCNHLFVDSGIGILISIILLVKQQKHSF